MRLRLPVHPGGAYFAALLTGPAEPITYWELVRAYDRVPSTSVQEIREAEACPMTLSILLCRDTQLEELRRRALLTPKEVFG